MFICLIDLLAHGWAFGFSFWFVNFSIVYKISNVQLSSKYQLRAIKIAIFANVLFLWNIYSMLACIYMYIFYMYVVVLKCFQKDLECLFLNRDSYPFFSVSCLLSVIYSSSFVSCLLSVIYSSSLHFVTWQPSDILYLVRHPIG